MIHHERTLDFDATPDAVWAEIERFMHVDEFAPVGNVRSKVTWSMDYRVKY